MKRTIHCANCGGENTNVNVSLRVLGDDNQVLVDEASFTCKYCKFKIIARIETTPEAKEQLKLSDPNNNKVGK